MRQLIMDENRINVIGKQGENDATAAIFDTSGWADRYGNGFFELIHKRPTDSVAYPCTIETAEESVTWIVKDSDLTVDGYGECELTYVVNQTIAKSITFTTHIISSVEGVSEDPAPPYENRIQELIQASANITANIERAETAAENAENSALDSLEFSRDSEAFKNEAAGIMGLATFEIDIETGELRVRYPNPYFGATFRINEDGYLEVIRHA